MSDAKSELLALLGKHPELFPKVTAEKYPHVLTRIVAQWHSPRAMEDYFGELMVVDERRKQGFPEEVMLEIFALSNLHDKLFPKPPGSPLNVWNRTQESLNGRKSQKDANE